MTHIQRWGAFLLTLWGTLQATGLLHAQGPGLILAHRGGLAEFEENTMEGFRACYEKGIRGFETDIRMTQDGELVILHDDKLDRTYNATGSVENKPAAELRNITSRKHGHPVLFLQELLAYFADKPGVYIELEMKTSNKKLYPDSRLDEYCRKLFAAANAHQPQGATYVFTSFDERPIRIIHALDPKAPLSLIASKPCSSEFIQRAKELGADRIACQLNGTSRSAVREAQKAGLLVNGWPGHSLQDYYLALGLGVDIHCTDMPVALLAWQERWK